MIGPPGVFGPSKRIFRGKAAGDKQNSWFPC
jgi:hypothetical protein